MPVPIYKPAGLTPLQCVEQYKIIHTELENTVISYAGRLDPMAHGLLLLLIGEENKKREMYLHLDKTYEVEVLLGFETDTCDILGKVVNVSKVSEVSKENIEQVLKDFIGKREQEYPAYSSKAVLGKPLFWWARNDKLSEITIPKKEVEIFNSEFLSSQIIRGEDLMSDIEKRITSVTGNFRQKEIISCWEKSTNPKDTYSLVTISVHCSSGTYMRSLANDIGNKLGFGAIAYTISRKQLGEFVIEDAENIFN